MTNNLPPMPMVSIITPVYNCGSFVKDTIRSAQSQTFRDWEMIVVDDCSTDDTVQVVRDCAAGDDRIRLLVNAENSGAAVSRNRALREAKGEWVAFLDSDDLWMPGKLERQLAFMKEHGYAFTYHDYVEVDELGHETGVHVSGKRKVSRFDMYSCCWPGCLSVMYDRRKVGLIQIADVKKNNDTAMWLKIIRKTPCHLLPETLACYRRRRQSITPPDIRTKILWHYRLFRQAEAMNCASAAFWTVMNIFGNCFKKLFYVKKYDVNNNGK